MDFGGLLEYLAPLAFLLIALFNSFLRKKYNFGAKTELRGFCISIINYNHNKCIRCWYLLLPIRSTPNGASDW